MTREFPTIELDQGGLQAEIGILKDSVQDFLNCECQHSELEFKKVQRAQRGRTRLEKVINNATIQSEKKDEEKELDKYNDPRLLKSRNDERFNKLLDENDKYKEEIEGLKSQLRQCAYEKTQLSSEAQFLKEQNHAFRKDIDVAIEKNIQCKETIQSQEKTITELNTIIQTLKQQNDEYKAQVDQLDAWYDHHQLSHKLNAISQLIHDKNQEIVRLTNDIKTMGNQMSMDEQHRKHQQQVKMHNSKYAIAQVNKFHSQIKELQDIKIVEAKKIVLNGYRIFEQQIDKIKRHMLQLCCQRGEQYKDVYRFVYTTIRQHTEQVVQVEYDVAVKIQRISQIYPRISAIQQGISAIQSAVASQKEMLRQNTTQLSNKVQAALTLMRDINVTSRAQYKSMRLCHQLACQVMAQCTQRFVATQERGRQVRVQFAEMKANLKHTREKLLETQSVAVWPSSIINHFSDQQQKYERSVKLLQFVHKKLIQILRYDSSVSLIKCLQSLDGHMR